MITEEQIFRNFPINDLTSWLATSKPELQAVPDSGDAQRAMASIDLTSLDGNDNRNSISNLCSKALDLAEKSGQPVAAVCVYPNFISLCRERLSNSGIKTACVAGGFPSAQGMTAAKVAEIRMAREEGSEEIETVFPRGYLFSGEWNQLTDELARMREAAGNACLKIILETGELKHPELIAKASFLSLTAGADFIKTSTGKTPTGFTEDAFLIMIKSILHHAEQTGKKAGVKASGGVVEPETAFWCLSVLRQLAGNEWINPGLFRIGASRLADKLMIP